MEEKQRNDGNTEKTSETSLMVQNIFWRQHTVCVNNFNSTPSRAQDRREEPSTTVGSNNLNCYLENRFYVTFSYGYMCFSIENFMREITWM